MPHHSTPHEWDPFDYVMHAIFGVLIVFAIIVVVLPL